MAPRDLNDDYHDDTPEPDTQTPNGPTEAPATRHLRRHVRRRSVLSGMLWGVILIGGGLIALNEMASPPDAAPPVAKAPPPDARLPMAKVVSRSAALGQEGTEPGVDGSIAMPYRIVVSDDAAADKAANRDERVAVVPDAGPDLPEDGAMLTALAAGADTALAEDTHTAALRPDTGPPNALGSPAIGELRGTYIPVVGPAIEVNARPIAVPDDAGMLAIVLYGATSDVWLAQAMDEISVPVTLAVRADQPEQVRLATDARERGFEILAELPLMTDDRDASAELTGWEAPEEVEARVADVLVTLNMAVGAVAPDGAAMLYDIDAMTSLLKPIAAHSFLWVEPRASDRSAAARIEDGSSLILLQADGYAGPGDSADDVYDALERAARAARTLGTSVLFVPATPEGLRGLIEWGFQRSAADVVLTPISAVVRKRGQGGDGRG